ncbi:VWA domain-containing protein [Sinimarinibacterium sp. CAU 1509]|uniref:VWA domain-containing protein n=1 Tax=Sinimarinibacterium sp. CAU 1509 TaxID=2562283 RepID=UPI0010AD247D|nr:VWA domain-containing protein [Sinimarinibacterium sp. CAU 1509]TJY59458.1 VWA domain-containing protein [Sinimarinibacterium sp. CAU 1509]
MIQLAWPWIWLCLPLPWLLARVLPPAKPQGTALFLPFATRLSASAAVGTPTAPRLRTLALVLIWVLLVGAASRPQWLGDPQPVPTSGRRLLLAVDVSRSMAAEDMAGGYSRLQVVQAVAGEFIKGRQGDQVGLILFATQPYLQAPLTNDLNTASTFLREAMVGMAGTQTAIGDAIGLALKRLRDSDAKPGETVLILLTDGSNTAGAMPPLQAAKLAADAGLRIYTIGVGGAPQRGFFGLVSGGSDLDEDTLKAIAQTTGGAYFRATDAQALQQVYESIDKLEPAAGRDQWYRPTTEWFRWPLGLALLLSVPAVVLRARA